MSTDKKYYLINIVFEGEIVHQNNMYLGCIDMEPIEYLIKMVNAGNNVYSYHYHEISHKQYLNLSNAFNVNQ